MIVVIIPYLFLCFSSVASRTDILLFDHSSKIGADLTYTVEREDIGIK